MGFCIGFNSQKPGHRWTQIREKCETAREMRDPQTYEIVGCAMEVHRELGNGFLEPVYQEALELEFDAQDIPYKSQPEIQIEYKGRLLRKRYQPDFICYDRIVVEIKALSDLSSTEEAQIINYLKAAGLNTGLLINFGTKSLQYRRFVYGL